MSSLAWACCALRPCYPAVYVTQTNGSEDRSEGAAAAQPRPLQSKELDVGRDRVASGAVLTSLRYAAPVFAAFSLLLVMAGGTAELNEDLQLFVPQKLASRAQHLPLRALRYGKLLDAQGPVLIHEGLAVQIATANESHAGRLEPAPNRLLDLEANLPLPALVPGEWIEVVARGPGQLPDLEVRARVQVRETLEVVLPQGRALRALQQFAPGAVQVEPSAIAPDALAVRVRGGACVPEQRCSVVVWIGSPQASLRVQPNSTLTPSAAALRGTKETSGVVSLAVTTHGPEAQLWLIAERGGQRVARRSVRLPVAMGALSVETNQRVVERSDELLLHSPAAPSGCIVDAFQEGHWRDTGSLPDCTTPRRLPFELGGGLWRLQLRRDAFAGETAGVAAVYVRSAKERAAQVASAWARAAVRLAPTDRFVRDCAGHPERCADPAALEYLAATVEIGLLALPPPVTGYAARMARAREQNTRMRWLALAALLLGAVGLVLSVSRSGVSAGVRASQLFADDPAAARRARLRALLLSGASGVSLLLVFVVLALYVLARGGY